MTARQAEPGLPFRSVRGLRLNSIQAFDLQPDRPKFATFSQNGVFRANDSGQFSCVRVARAVQSIQTGMVQSRVTTDLVCAMVCASEGNGRQKSGRHGEFDLRFGLRLVCALVCARHTGRSANQINPE